MKILNRYSIAKPKSGFTIIELLIVIAIIGILSTIGIVSFINIQVSARDTQRSSRINVIAEALEKYFEINGEYPSCEQISATPNEVSALIGVDPEVLTAPNDIAGTNSILDSCADLSAESVSDKFAYISSGGTYYTLKYKEESSNQLVSIDSRHQVETPTYILNVSAGIGGTVSASGTYSSGSTQTITATPAAYYSFTSWTGSTGCSGVASHTIVMDANKTCTANFTPTAIAAPATPTVTANTVGATTTFSWGVASCPGNTARYQYRYTISPSGYDSGLVATASTSVAFTTSTEAQTYTVATQAQCYNTATSSDWSTAGSGSYYRPITVIADTFNRTSSSLGSTSTTNIAWSALSGTWSTNGTKAVTSAAVSTNPLAVVDFTHSDVDASVDVSSSGGGDSLIIRATDSNNYIRARYYHTSAITTPASCTIGGWVTGSLVYTELTVPGQVWAYNSDVIQGSCIPYDDLPAPPTLSKSITGVADKKTVITSTRIACEYPYVYADGCYQGREYTRTVVDNPAITTHYYYIYIDKMTGGVLTTLASPTIASSVSKIRLKAQGSTITLYVNGSSTSTTSITNTFNQTATKHGIGRGVAGDYSTSSIDNFSLTMP